MRTTPQGVASASKRRRLGRAGRLGVALLGAAGLMAGPLAGAAVAQPASSGARAAQSSTQQWVYNPVTPTRIEGSLTSSGGPIGPGGTLNVDVTSLDSSVPSTAGAVVLDVTAVNPTAAGFLSVYPTGSISDPMTADANGTLTSNLNFAAGQTVANLVEVPLSSSGSVTIYNHAGSTGVDVDVFGYYSPLPSTGATSGLYNPVNPDRVLGSLQAGQSVGQDSTTPVTVAGVDGVPSDATAVVVNITASDATNGGYVSAYAAGTSKPVVSNLNYAAGQIVANRAVVPVGSNGQIDLYNSFGPGVTSGSVNLDVDLDGYYTGSASESGGAFVAMSSPMRVIDTRSSMNGTSIAANSTEKFTIPSSDVPTAATAVAANVTVVPETMNPGFLTIYPTSDSSAPVASDINWTGGMIVPNFTYLPTDGSGSFNAFNNPGGAVNLIADVFGYFTPVTVSSALEMTATPASIDTNGSSTIDITVLHQGSPVGGDPVALSASGSNGCTVSNNLTSGGNSIFNSTVTTGSSGSPFTGTVEVTYSGTSIAGSCTITATEADYDQSNSVTITQTAVPAANTVGSISVTGAENADSELGVVSIPETTTKTPTTYELKSTIKPPSGATLDGQTASWTFTSIPTSPNACGVTGTVTQHMSGLSFTAEESYVPTTNSGFCEVTLTTSNGGSQTLYIDQTNVGSSYNVALTKPSSTTNSNSANVVSNGTATQSLQAKVTGSQGPVPNDPVLLVSAIGPVPGTPPLGTPFNICGTVSPTEGATNSSGQISSTYTASSVFGPIAAASECRVYAVDANSGGVSSAFIVTQIPYILNISVSPASTTVPVSSPSSITLTVTVTGANGTPINGDTVSAARSNTAPYNYCGTFPSSVVTNTAGQAVFSYTAANTTGFCKITFEEADTSASTTAIIDQTSS